MHLPVKRVAENLDFEHFTCKIKILMNIEHQIKVFSKKKRKEEETGVTDLSSNTNEVFSS